MRIDYALVASDDNPKYLDFWPIVSRLWKEKIGITPILLFFGQNSYPSQEHGLVVQFSPVNDEDTPLATCWARYWFPSEFPNKTFIISDIDMLPLSKWYFVDQLLPYRDEDYLHLNPCIETYTRLPSCYHVAKGHRFKEILELHEKFKDSFEHLKSMSFNNDNDYRATGYRQWCYDEYHASEMIMKKNSAILIRRDGGESGHRIDRTNWKYTDEDVKNGYYYDSHSIRPYSEHKNEIDHLISLI